MQAQNLGIIDRYKLAYQNFKRSNSTSNDVTEIINFTPEYDLLRFPATHQSSSKIFLITPSIFNSHRILTIGRPNDLITLLSKHGTVYVIRWNEVTDTDFDLTSYTKLTAKTLRHIQTLHGQNIEVIGHCLGGVFSLAAAIICKEYVNSLILLTCPWDFTYLQNYRTLYQRLGLDESILNQDYVPAIYLQILFLLLHPKSLDQKLDFYRIHHNDYNGPTKLDQKNLIIPTT